MQTPAEPPYEPPRNPLQGGGNPEGGVTPLGPKP